MLTASAQVYAANRTISSGTILQGDLTIPAGDTYTFEGSSGVRGSTQIVGSINVRKTRGPSASPKFGGLDIKDVRNLSFSGSGKSTVEGGEFGGDFLADGALCPARAGGPADRYYYVGNVLITDASFVRIDSGYFGLNFVVSSFAFPSLVGYVTVRNSGVVDIRGGDFGLKGGLLRHGTRYDIIGTGNLNI